MDEPCEHGYVAACAECRGGEQTERQWREYNQRHEGGTRESWAARKSEINGRLAELDGYPRRSNAQDAEVSELIAEQAVLALLLDQADVAARSEKIEHLKRVASDPANREGPDGGTQPYGAPAVVKGLGDRTETPAESLQRMRSNPWQDGGGPLNRETGAGLVTRCHAALEGMEDALTRDGAQMLANLMSERPSFTGPYEIRSGEDIKRSAAWILALSSPHYRTAFEKILRAPEAFRSGAGVLLWDDDERQAYTDVIYRAALIENTGTGGTYWLPLYLDPSVILTNAGAASPWRKYCRVVQTTSNTWNGVASAGVTSQWLAEGATAADATPTITQLQIPVFKRAAWVMASYELEGDQPNVAQSVPGLVADGNQRLEEAAFVTGNGTSAPAGTITRATVDGSTGLVNVANAVSVFSLLTNLPVRFRTYPSANPFWVANIAIINALRAVTAFTAATAPIVDDSTTPPKMFGYPFEESTTMDAVNTTGGHKNLLLLDGNSYLIVDRIGTQMIYEPLVASSGGILPSGTSGWFAWSRLGADVATATALRVHNNV
jgi:HK97 family phage major capsid protein